MGNQWYSILMHIQVGIYSSDDLKLFQDSSCEKRVERIRSLRKCGHCINVAFDNSGKSTILLSRKLLSCASLSASLFTFRLFYTNIHVYCVFLLLFYCHHTFPS